MLVTRATPESFGGDGGDKLAVREHVKGSVSQGNAGLLVQQSLDASHVVDADGAQVIVDTNDTQDDSSIGAIDTQGQEKQPLSGDALIEYFQLVYDASSMYVSDMSVEEAIKLELSILETKVENDGELLPLDYADQYIAWRPVETASRSAVSANDKM